MASSNTPAAPSPWDTHFPSEIDADFYRSQYPDLRRMTSEEAVAHFAQYGRAEGRQASPAALRAAFTAYLPTDQRALEIGPGADPVLRGPHVSYFDVHDTAGMRQWAKGVGKDPAEIPQITYTDPAGDLGVIDATFGFVFSSHCVEHQPDLIGHLNKVHDLLAPGGIYAFILPDARFCFDALRPRSSVGAVVAAHVEGHRVHSLANRIDHQLLATHNEAGRHWEGEHGAPQGNAQSILDAVALWQKARDQYVDTHAWQLDPQLLRDVLKWSQLAGYLKPTPLRVYDTPKGQFEFMVVVGA